MSDDTAPLVSVIMPTYNHGHYLGRALQSVLDQTYTNWEVIVIDNYSTDNTDEVMASFADPRITCLKINNHGVIAVSRNVGIRAAKGEWIAFLDSDDWWSPNKLKECHQLIEKHFDVIYHELEVIRPRKSWKRRLIGSWQVSAPAQIDLLLRGNALATSSVVVRSDVLDKTSGFNESRSMVACEDYNLWLQLAGVTELFSYCPGVLGFYTDDGKGMSNKDLASSEMSAVESFMYKLSPSQKKCVEARVRYLKLRYAYRTRNYQFVRLSAFKSVVTGSVFIRVKSLFMFFASIVKYTQSR